MYFISLVILIQEASPEGVAKSELTLLEDALDANDPKLLTDVGRISKGYKNLSEGLINLQAPETLRANHAALITSTARLSSIIEAFSLVFDDAIYALAVLPEYQVEADRLAETLKVIDEELSKSAFYNLDKVIAARQALGL